MPWAGSHLGPGLRPGAMEGSEERPRPRLVPQLSLGAAPRRSPARGWGMRSRAPVRPGPALEGVRAGLRPQFLIFFAFEI